VPATPEALVLALADCQARAPDEAVGLVLEDEAGRQAVVPLPNALPTPACRRGFAVAPADWMAAERRAQAAGERVCALYHSHPAGPFALSEEDRRLATPGGQPLTAGLELWLIGPDERGILNQIEAFSFIRGAWRRANPCSLD
jgi:proteasome lid subunit RPN8/RPN11